MIELCKAGQDNGKIVYNVMRADEDLELFAKTISKKFIGDIFINHASFKSPAFIILYIDTETIHTQEKDGVFYAITDLNTIDESMKVCKEHQTILGF